MDMLIISKKRYKYFPLKEQYEFALIIVLDHDRGTFDIDKNRYGQLKKNVPMEFLMDYIQPVHDEWEKKNAK